MCVGSRGREERIQPVRTLERETVRREPIRSWGVGEGVVISRDGAYLSYAIAGIVLSLTTRATGISTIASGPSATL